MSTHRHGHKNRDYQDRCVAAVFKEFETVRSTLAVLATGLGKTFIFSDIIRKMHPQRTMVLAHRGELLTQAAKHIEAHGLETSIEKAALHAGSSFWNQTPAVVASVQTLISENGDTKRLHKFNPMDFGLIVVDEAHHATAKSYTDILDYFKSGNPNIKILGVTATPERADEAALGRVFESVAFEFELMDACKEGWLVYPWQHMIPVAGLDYSHIRTTAGDLNGADLSAVMEREDVCMRMVHPTLEVIYGLPTHTLDNVPVADWGAYLRETGRKPKQTLAFTASVAHADMVADIFNRVVPGIAASVNGKTPENERNQLNTDFKTGQLAILCNCGTHTEGFDSPSVEIVMMGRPTKSKVLYQQMLGRGTRALPGVVDGPVDADGRHAAIAGSAKPRLDVIDFVGNAGRHSLVCSADIFSGNMEDEVVERAKKRAEKDGAARMDELLEEEQAKLAEEREKRRQEEAARRAHLVAKAQFSVQTFNPFEVWRIKPARVRARDEGKQLSEKQSNLLLRQGVDVSGMSYAQSKQLLNEMFRRWKGKLATLKQCKLLAKRGIDASKMTMDEAGAEITKIATAEGWNRAT